MWPFTEIKRRRLIRRIVHLKGEFDRLAPSVLGPEWEAIRTGDHQVARKWLADRTGCDMQTDGFAPLVQAMMRMEAAGIARQGYP